MRAYFAEAWPLVLDGFVDHFGGVEGGLAAAAARARAFMKADPAVAAGVFEAALHPINFSLVRERDRL